MQHTVHSQGFPFNTACFACRVHCRHPILENPRANKQEARHPTCLRVGPLFFVFGLFCESCIGTDSYGASAASLGPIGDIVASSLCHPGRLALIGRLVPLVGRLLCGLSWFVWSMVEATSGERLPLDACRSARRCTNSHLVLFSPSHKSKPLPSMMTFPPRQTSRFDLTVAEVL